MFSAITKGLRDVRILEGGTLPAITAVPGFFYNTTLERLYFQSPDEAANLDLTGLSGLDGGNTFKNAIINGDMRIAQRGTSGLVAVGGGIYTLDRWRWGFNTTAARHTISQDSDVPNNQFRYSMKLDVTTADATVSANDLAIMQTRIEGYNFRKFVGQQATFSFWIKSSKTGTMCVGFLSSNGDRNYIAEVDIDQASTWEKKTITLDFDYSGGTWNYENGLGLAIHFCFMCDTAWQGTADTWNTSIAYGSSGQDNFMDHTDNNIWITGVQLELGPVDTAFEFLDYENQLAQCHRYYERVASDLFAYGEFGNGYTNTAGTTSIIQLPYTEKRASPSFSFSAAGHFQCVSSSGNSGATSIVVATTSYTRKMLRVNLTHGNIGVSTGSLMRANNATSAWIAFDAEL